MNQEGKHFDSHEIGQEIKRKRLDKKWTQEKLGEMVNRTDRTIMSIENDGQHPSLDVFYQLVTLLDISVDQYFFPEKKDENRERRNHIERLLQGLNNRELSIVETMVESIINSRETEAT